MRKAFLACTAGVLLSQHAGVASADSENVGDVLRAAIPGAAYLLTFREQDRDGRMQFYKSFGATVAGTWVLKEAFDKKRPDGTGDDAFPSGHAATAFQGAAFIHRRYGIKKAWPAYVLATYTGWTRVDADEHDNADVLAGAAVGIASSFFLAKRRNVNVTALAEPSTRTYGLRITGHF